MKQVLKRYFPALRDHEVTQDSDRTTMVPASAIGVDLIIYTLLAFWSNAQVLATLTNITIDDTDSTFWSWAGSWHAVTPTTPCPGCAAQPDPALVYNSTWHDGSLRSGAFTFQGTAVYIYGIDFSGQSSAGTILFTLRNTSVTAFHDDFAEDYVYNSLYFSATDLDSSIQHTVTWTLDSNPGDGAGLFDYAVVTVNQRDPYSNSASSTTNAAGRATVVGSSPLGSSTAPSESATPTASPAAPGNAHTAAIVGAVVGAVGGLALFSAVFIFLHRRRVAATNYSIEPYPPERVSAPLAPALVPQPPFFSGKSSLPRSVPSPLVSTATSAPVVMASAPVASRTLPVNSNYMVPYAPGAMALARDPHYPDGGRGNLEVEMRLRHLEDLATVEASQPPSYH